MQLSSHSNEYNYRSYARNKQNTYERFVFVRHIDLTSIRINKPNTLSFSSFLCLLCIFTQCVLFGRQTEASDVGLALPPRCSSATRMSVLSPPGRLKRYRSKHTHTHTKSVSCVTHHTLEWKCPTRHILCTYYRDVTEPNAQTIRGSVLDCLQWPNNSVNIHDTT